jgi:outer membrane translocation and assembly module TamA
MSGRALLLIVPLFLLCIPSAFAQLPKRVEKCLPYPTLAQEIGQLQLANPTPVRLRVVRVEFDPTDGIPASLQDTISTQLRSHIFEPDADTDYLNDLADEIAEASVIMELQKRGYFKAAATVKLTAAQKDSAEIDVTAAVRATPGPQYQVGHIRFESANSAIPLTMSIDVLRGLIPLQPGELFDVERLRAGLQNLRLAYGRDGYAEMVASPDPRIDEARKTIDVVLQIDQEAQYRVGTIEFLGVSPATREKLMESLFKSGDIFDDTRLGEFLNMNRAILPSDVSRNDVTVTHNPKTKTVAILFDFRTCPANPN